MCCCFNRFFFLLLFFRSTKQQISRLYLDNGVSIWNGNGITGKDNIQIFYQNLPSSEHTVVSCDAQPVVIEENASNQKTMLISVAGLLRAQSKTPKQFQQSFMICTQADKWKIVNDSFRIQDALCGTDMKSNWMCTLWNWWAMICTDISFFYFFFFQ